MSETVVDPVEVQRELESFLPVPEGHVVDVSLSSGLFAEVSLDPASRKKLLARIQAAVAAGEEEADVIEELGLTREQYDVVRQDYYRQHEVGLQSKLRPEHAFIDWLVYHRALIRELNDFIKAQQVAVASGSQAEGQPQTVRLVDMDPKAHLGAIKLKSEIYEKMIDRGQNLGLIKKATDTKLVGVVVSELDDKAFMELIVKEISEFERVMRVYGTTDIYGRALTGAAP